MNDPERLSGPDAADLSDPILAEWVEELNRKLQAGEAVDIEAYAKQHPGRAVAVLSVKSVFSEIRGIG